MKTDYRKRPSIIIRYVWKNNQVPLLIYVNRSSDFRFNELNKSIYRMVADDVIEIEL